MSSEKSVLSPGHSRYSVTRATLSFFIGSPDIGESDSSPSPLSCFGVELYAVVIFLLLTAGCQYDKASPKEASERVYRRLVNTLGKRPMPARL
jgi:hypothetical protein